MEKIYIVLFLKVSFKGGCMQVLTLQETKKSRIYNFIEFDEVRHVYIHKQLENRNGKILMRSKVRSYQTSD